MARSDPGFLPFIGSPLDVGGLVRYYYYIDNATVKGNKMTQATLSQEIEMIETAIVSMQNGGVTQEQANNFALHIVQMQNKNAKAVGLQFTKTRLAGIKNGRPVYRMLEVAEVIELAKKLLAA